MVIERAQSDDFDELEALVESTFIETWTGIVDDSHLHQHLSEGHAKMIVERLSQNPQADVFVVRGEQGLVGYAVGLRASEDDEFSLGDYYRLEKLYLKQSIHGHGVGKQLLGVMVDVAKASGAIGIYLTHYPLNVRASNFYSRIGMRKVADTIYMCGDGEYHDWVLAAKWHELTLISDEKGVIA